MTAGRRGRCEKAPPSQRDPSPASLPAPLTGELFGILSWTPFPGVSQKLSFSPSREGEMPNGQRGLTLYQMNMNTNYLNL